MIILSVGRIASVTYNKRFKVYNPKKEFKLDVLDTSSQENMYSLCQLSDGNIIIGLTKNMKIYSFSDNKLTLNFTIQNAHEERINKIISLRDKMFASCSDDQFIKIWINEEPYRQTPIKVLEGHTDEIKSFLYLEDKDEIISIAKDLTVRAWNVNTLQ